MRLLSCLECERSFGARSGSYFVRIPYGGSLLVYGVKDQAIDQKTAAAPNSSYACAKLEAEVKLRQLTAESGMAFVSLRLPHVYGAMSLLFDQVRNGRILFPGRGDNTFAHLHVTDAARVGAASLLAQ